jgi:small-conductance mechanosensitive channel
VKDRPTPRTPFAAALLAGVLLAVAWPRPALAQPHALSSAAPAALAPAPPVAPAPPPPAAPEPLPPAAPSPLPGTSVVVPTMPPLPVPPVAVTAPLAAAPAASAAAASSSPSEGGHAVVTPRAAAVSIHDRRVFEVMVERAGHKPEERAAAASQVLERLLEEREEPEVRVQQEGDVAIVFGGKTPIIQLGPEDAAAAGDASASVHANDVAEKVRSALRAERQRSAIATTVFAFSLLVFSGLIAFLLVRKVGELLEKLRGWVDENPGKLPALRVRGIEVVQPTAVRGGIGVAISGAHLVARVGIFYAWVLIALSLFDATHDYSERLTGFVLTPVSALMGRVAVALPLLVIALVTVLAVGVSLRFVRLFFGSMARGETTVGWMPRDLAEPTSILVRTGIVVVTLVVAAPLITGADDGTLSRAGVVALVALGLAATPLLACAAAGIAVVFGRQLRVGEFAVVAGREGRVRALTMLEVLLEDEDGCKVHVPHLLGLMHPTRVVGAAPLVAVELSVDPSSDLGRVVEVLRKAAGGVGGRARVEVIGLDLDGARIRVAVTARGGADRNALYVALSAALHAEGVGLGRSGPTSAKVERAS